MNEAAIIDALEKAWDVVKKQATDTFEMATAADLHKDRDVVIGVSVAVLGGLFLTSSLFWVGVGYLTYHFVRRDDHVRNAVEAEKAEKVASDQ